MTIIPAANYVIGLHPSWPGTIRWEMYKLRLQAQGDLVDVNDMPQLSRMSMTMAMPVFKTRFSGWQPNTHKPVYPY